MNRIVDTYEYLSWTVSKTVIKGASGTSIRLDVHPVSEA